MKPNSFFRITSQKLSIAASILLGAGLLFFTGCKKTDFAESKKEATQKQAKGKSWFITNEKVDFLPSDSEGNPLSQEQIANRNKKGLNLLSTCDDWDPGITLATYNGHVSDIICSRGATEMVYIKFTYEVHSPSIPVYSSSSNIGRTRVSAAAWPTFSPAATLTAPLTITYLTGEDYYDAIFDATMKKYKVEYWIGMEYATFCGYQAYRSNITIEFECENIGLTTSSYTAAHQFTPEAYQPYEYFATPTTENINFWPGILLCYTHCHFPSLGSSTEHEVQYRLSGTSTWTTVSYTDLLDHDITVVPGTYEYRSRGLVTESPDVFSDYTTIETVVVP